MKTTTLLLASLALAATAAAQTLVSYEFTGATTLPVPPTSVGAGVAATGITKGNILNVVPNNNLLSVGPDGNASTASSAVSSGYYFEFTVTPTVVGKLDLGALLFKVRREQAGGMGWVVRSSVDNFGADIATAAIPTVSPTFSGVGISLPVAQFTGLGGPVTFRIYTYQDAALYFADYDDVQLVGNIDHRPTVGVFSQRNVVTARSRLLLTGAAYDDKGVVRVTVNGRRAAGTRNWRAIVSLRPGINRVRIIATDTAGSVSTALNIRVRLVDVRS